MNTATQNPLVMYAFLILTVVLVALTWRTIRKMWVGHGSVASLRKRQLTAAQKDELIYAQAAEYYTALAKGSRATIDRLTIPVGLDETVADAKGALYIPPTTPETYAAADDFSDIPNQPR